MSRLFDHISKKRNKIKLASRLLLSSFLYSRIIISYFLSKQKEHCQEGRSADGEVVVGGGK